MRISAHTYYISILTNSYLRIALLPGKSGSDQLLHFQYQEVDGTQLGKYYIMTLDLTA